MKPSVQPAPQEIATPSAKRALVLYDDFDAADDAIEFALNLDSEVGVPMERPLAHWWVEMVEVPGVAAAVRRELAASSYVILALSGACHLSTPVRQWLRESLLQDEAKTTALLVLTDVHRTDVRKLGEVRGWLEQVAAGKGISVFFYGPAASSKLSNVIGGVAMLDDETVEDCFVGACDAFPRRAWAA